MTIIVPAYQRRIIRELIVGEKGDYTSMRFVLARERWHFKSNGDVSPFKPYANRNRSDGIVLQSVFVLTCRSARNG